jgi:hypothetical protein
MACTSIFFDKGMDMHLSCRVEFLYTRSVSVGSISVACWGSVSTWSLQPPSYLIAACEKSSSNSIILRCFTTTLLATWPASCTSFFLDCSYMECGVAAPDCPWEELGWMNRLHPTPEIDVDMLSSFFPRNCKGNGCWGSTFMRIQPTPFSRPLHLWIANSGPQANSVSNRVHVRMLRWWPYCICSLLLPNETYLASKAHFWNPGNTKHN